MTLPSAGPPTGVWGKTMSDNENKLSRRSVLKHSTLATGSVILGGTAATGTAAAGIGDGRVAHYNLNNLHLNKETDEKIKNFVHDASTENNHGTNNGSEVVNDGVVGKSYEFDGSDDYVEITDDSSLDIQDELTISFWFRLDGESDNNRYPRAVSKGQSTGGNGAYGVYIEDTGGTPNRIGLRFVDTVGDSHDVNTGNSLDHYDDEMWHHVVVTYSNSGNVGRLYFDNTVEVDKTFSDDISIRTTSDALHLGDGNGERHFNGALDEVRIYNRALSSSEVTELYEMK